jgi:hypothetical protein
MSSARLLRGDVLAFARHYHGPRFHALLCDPPYHLTSIVKRYGKNGSAPGQDNRASGPYARTPSGFMGKRWDGGDLAFQPETWAALAELLHPGAFGMAFASSRGWHRLAVAIEDAGLIIHPSVFGWLYGSGFPKATRIDTQVDKAAGAEREETELVFADGSKQRRTAKHYNDGEPGRKSATAPATPLAEAWAGHRYGLQALKPALEPIIVFQKPYQGRPVDSITQTGAGALWVDGGRIGTHEAIAPFAGPRKSSGGIMNATDEPRELFEQHPAGRWPANFALVCLPSCNGEHAPGCPVAALDGQAGERTSGKLKGIYRGNAPGSDVYGQYDFVEKNFESNTGTASRFFHRAAWELEHADPVLYQAKASRRERDAGLDGRDKKPLLWSSGTQNPGSFQSAGTDKSARNPHPTVKPIALSRWLATLLLPPADYAPRRLFVPFGGVGSEMIGAGLAGWDEVVGVEGEAEYVSIGRARLAHWLRQVEMALP